MKSQSQTKYVVCTYDGGDELSVVKGHLYRVVAPEKNDPESTIRIIDEEDEDYLYPREWFVAVELPEAAVKAMEAA